ncbi:glycerophosphodiester phosphodiesterase family protein [Chachezhania antarctica]|uniref:glycerophosphodiester phosphodiesterase family protein n=1 Tax=Chachezhania antarctica TaxID=2340860 RepID=UPI000EAFAB51|nr:glycerophosphodiester phosphodiesterase family protein [Chachezhania antarctica]|tara:strand:+ start:946 stop:1716 length:771 start_codon:yes stop_codon:yes gene_type:complete
MRPALPAAFTGPPIAHRALHDIAAGRPENALSAVRAAVAAGYGIEIDLQLTADGEAMVFHDYDLSRLTGRDGLLRDLTAAEAATVPLLGGDGECIPTLAAVRDAVNGEVPLLVEIKDQDRHDGPGVGPLEAAAARALQSYAGPVALMSFNPESMAEMSRLLPDVPRGLTTMSFDPDLWPLPAATCDRLTEIADFDRVEASFISHHAADFPRDRVEALRQAGVPVLCWTIRSPGEEAAARAFADNVTFEGYLPALPA